MARKVGDPTLLKARLEAALKQAKPRDIASAQPMAEIVGMTWAGFRNNHITPDAKFPVKTRGAEGKQWEFQVAKVLRYMIKICDKKIAANNHRNRRNQEMQGVDLPEKEKSADVSEVSVLVSTTLKVFAAKERQGLYTSTEDLVDFLNGLNSEIVGGILGITNQVDPTGLFSPEIRAAMDECLISHAVSVQKTTQKYLETKIESLRKAGIITDS